MGRSLVLVIAIHETHRGDANAAGCVIEMWVLKEGTGGPLAGSAAGTVCSGEH